MLEYITQIKELGKSSRDVKQTEVYALEREKAFDKYYSELSEIYDEIISEIDKAIIHGDTEKYLSMINCCYSDMQFLDEFLELKAIADICYEELQHGKEKTFLAVSNGRIELLRVFRELKFILYRLQFDCQESDLEYLCRFLKGHDISEYMLEYMMRHCTLDGLKMTLCVAKELMKNGMIQHAAYLLESSLGEAKNTNE